MTVQEARRAIGERAISMSDEEVTALISFSRKLATRIADKQELLEQSGAGIVCISQDNEGKPTV